MANLRANKITGTGGRNAIDGSVFFDGSTSYLESPSSSDFAYGTGDFTWEAWVLLARGQATGYIFDHGNDGGTLQYASNKVRYYNSTTGNSGALYDDGGSIDYDGWHHLAVARSSGTTKLFVNGLQKASASDSHNYSAQLLTIGDYGANTGTNKWKGYLSNLRILKGTAVYTAAFTPPTEKLTAIDGTVLLCCQDSDDPTQEATGKTITGYGKLAAGQPIQPKKVPPVGVDEGVVFDGDTKINTQGVMYFPTGDTSQRGRGRGLFMGGYAPSQYRTEIDYIQIQSQGNAIDFGVLSGTGLGEGADCASSTRAIQGGGSLVNTMEYVTIATTSNTTDFGDLTVARRSLQSLSNETRGTWAGGTTNPAMSDVIDYVTIASAGNATDFGNLTVGRRNLAQAASSTRGVWAGGNPGSGPLVDDTIDYITIASAGNATDFGNLSAAYREMSGCSNGTRGVFGGGSPGPTQINTMEYITIATAGNVTDFGDLFYAQGNGGGTSNGTRGIFAGGSGAAYTNVIQYVTIATTGNAADFGDLTVARILYSATSDSHGGLS